MPEIPSDTAAWAAAEIMQLRSERDHARGQHELAAKEVERLTRSIAWRCPSCGCAFPDNPEFVDQTKAAAAFMATARCGSCADVAKLTKTVSTLEAEVERLQEYEFMYKELC
jgi:outer membrane murein-binding lipoprotein Lpp